MTSEIQHRNVHLFPRGYIQKPDAKIGMLSESPRDKREKERLGKLMQDGGELCEV